MTEAFRIWFIVGMVVVAGVVLVAWGDSNGLNARKLAAIKTDLDKANARIKGFTQADDQAAIDADVLRNEGYERALKDLSATDKCIATETMVRAINRISR